MARTLIKCEKCKEKTEHLFSYSSPYGIAGAVMAGSERYKCVNCGNSVTPNEANERDIETKDNYHFLINGKITADDLKRIVTLTTDGRLEWRFADGYYAFSGNPSTQRLRDNEKACKAVIGENLRGLRIGFHPDTKLWEYLRITDHNTQHYYVGEGASEKLKELVKEIYLLAAIKISKDRGVIA